MVKLLTNRKGMASRAISTLTIPFILLNLFFFTASCKKNDTNPTADVPQSKIVMHHAETNMSATVTPDYVISFNSAKTLVIATASAGSGLANYSGAFNAVITNVIAALKKGGVILIDNGNYINLKPILIPYPNITIEGQGASTTVLKFEAKADAVLTTYMNLINVAANNFVIQNIQLDGNSVNQTRIDNNDSENAKQSGVWSRGNNTQVISCYIHDFTVYGCYAGLSARNFQVVDCQLANNNWNQVTFDVGTSNNSVIDCQVTGGADVGISAYGKGHLIEGNTIKNISGIHGATGSGWGIGLEINGATVPSGSMVKDNIITGVIKKGIFVSAGTNCKIDSNSISSLTAAGGVGIYMNNTTSCDVTGNVINTVPTEGIYFDLGNYNNIAGNNVSLAGDIGLKMEAWQSGSVNNNKITSNLAGGINAGIFINATGTGTAIDNIVKDNTCSGIIPFFNNGTGTVDTKNYAQTVDGLVPLPNN
jgi:hypothetical protein